MLGFLIISVLKSPSCRAFRETLCKYILWSVRIMSVLRHHRKRDYACAALGHSGASPPIKMTTVCEDWMCQICGYQKMRGQLVCPNCGVNDLRTVYGRRKADDFGMDPTSPTSAVLAAPSAICCVCGTGLNVSSCKWSGCGHYVCGQHIRAFSYCVDGIQSLWKGCPCHEEAYRLMLLAMPPMKCDAACSPMKVAPSQFMTMPAPLAPVKVALPRDYRPITQDAATSTEIPTRKVGAAAFSILRTVTVRARGGDDSGTSSRRPMLVTVPRFGPVVITQPDRKDESKIPGATRASAEGYFVPGVTARSLNTSMCDASVYVDMEDVTPIVPRIYPTEAAYAKVVLKREVTDRRECAFRVLPATHDQSSFYQYKSYVQGGTTLSDVVMTGTKYKYDDFDMTRVKRVISVSPKGICRDRPATFF